MNYQTMPTKDLFNRVAEVTSAVKRVRAAGLDTKALEAERQPAFRELCKRADWK